MNLLMVLILFSILVCGCVYDTTASESTPRMVVMEKMNVYGKLLEHSNEGNITTFMIEAVSINDKTNNTILQVAAKVSDRPENMDFIQVDDVDELEIGKAYFLFGDPYHSYEYRSIETEGASLIFARSESVEYLDLDSLESGRLDVSYKVSKIDQLVNGGYYIFNFTRNEDSDWILVSLSESA